MGKYIKVKLTFTDEVLGTASADPDIHREFIASKAPDAESRDEEVARLGADAVADKSMTVFPRNAEGKPIMLDYQLRGFFKDACGALRRVSGTLSKDLKAYKKVIDGCIFVLEREIPFEDYDHMGNCQRPLRAQTAQGDRVALAESETIPAGATLTFTVYVMEDAHWKNVIEWLEYGKLRGLGQWRNSGKGRFTYEVLPYEE